MREPQRITEAERLVQAALLTHDGDPELSRQETAAHIVRTLQNAGLFVRTLPKAEDTELGHYGDKRIIKITAEDLRSWAGEGFHTAFRKATDAPQAHRIWQLIREMDDDEWHRVISWLMYPLDHYWNLVHPAEEDK